MDRPPDDAVPMGADPVEVNGIWDVAIIGGGPAGATAATLFARAGRRTLLIDRDRFPREKVCGEFLSWDALPILELLDVVRHFDAAGCPSIDVATITGARRSATFSLPGKARGVSRHMLDALLVRTAAEAGCEVLETHAVVGLSRTPAGYSLEVQNRADAEKVTIRASSVIGAWGRWGRLDQALSRQFASSTRRHFGFRRHAHATSYPRAANVIELHSFAGGYLGVASVEGAVANICGLVTEDRVTSRRGGWESFERELRDERLNLERMFAAHESAGGYISSDPVIFAGKEPSVLGIPLIGDTSGMIDPLTGNGMAMAIQSGALAFCSVMNRAARDWNSRWRETFAPRLRWSRLSASMLTRPDLVDAGLACRAAAPIGKLLAARTRLSREDGERLAEQGSRLL